MALFSKYLLSACYVLNIGQEAASVNKADKDPTLPEFTFLRVDGGRQSKQLKINKKILGNDTYHKENKK